MNSIILVVVLLLAIPVRAANIAIIDSGVDYKHKDLAAKMWTNPNQQTVDADGTKYADDTHGWNFPDNNNQIIDYKYLGTFPDDCYKMFAIQAKILRGTATAEDKAWYQSKKNDQAFLKQLSTFGNFIHGTHVSGISSADTDEAKLQAMKLIPTEQGGAHATMMDLATEALNREKKDKKGGGDNEMAKMLLGMLAQRQATVLVKIGKYVQAVNADVANGSFGTSEKMMEPIIAQVLKKILQRDPTQAEVQEDTIYFIQKFIDACQDFVAASPKTLFVFAAGNDGSDNDSLPTSPANVKADNTIAVAASFGTDSLASFSNYGKTMVDVAAPGVIIKSTIPGDQYLELSGTSMAAPFVTNVAGMVKDANPKLTPSALKQILVQTVDVKNFLKGKVVSAGIVNRARALSAAKSSLDKDLRNAIAQARFEVRDIEPSFAERVFGSDKDVLVVPLPGIFE